MMRGSGKLSTAVALSIVVIASTPTFAQRGRVRPIAYVITASGASRDADGEHPFPIAPTMRSPDASGLMSGGSVYTDEGGSAVIAIERERVFVHLGPNSILKLESRAGLSAEVAVKITLVKGNADVLRRTSDEKWLVVAAGTEGTGYTLSQGSSLEVSARADGVDFTVTAGSAWSYRGVIPVGNLIDASHEPMDKTGILLPEGHRVSVSQPAQPMAVEPVGLWERMGKELYQSALEHGGRWVQDAERGDFTPVYASGRASTPVLPAKLSAGFAFDQPRSAVVSPVARSQTRSLQAVTTSRSQALLESGIPSEVIIGQRLRRTRIIGASGIGSGQIRFNPAAVQLIRLAGQ